MAKLSLEKAQDVIRRIRVANVRVKTEPRSGKFIHYCGRRNVAFGFEADSPLHNMHNIGMCRADGCTHEHKKGGDTLPFFEVDFGAKILGEQADVMQKLREIWRQAADGNAVTMLCWCAPETCHCVSLKRIMLELATGIVRYEGDL